MRGEERKSQISKGRRNERAVAHLQKRKDRVTKHHERRVRSVSKSTRWTELVSSDGDDGLREREERTVS